LVAVVEKGLMGMAESQFLYLLRHAKADAWFPGVDDFERALTDRGVRHMELLAGWARQNLRQPGLVLCSPSTRTRQTLAPFLNTWPSLAEATRYEQSIYEATTGSLLTLAESAFSETDTVMLVGHNPGFEFLALSILRDQDAGEVAKMPTGGLAVIEFTPGWAEAVGDGQLVHWVRRRDFEADL